MENERAGAPWLRLGRRPWAATAVAVSVGSAIFVQQGTVTPVGARSRQPQAERSPAAGAPERPAPPPARPQSAPDELSSPPRFRHCHRRRDHHPTRTLHARGVLRISGAAPAPTKIGSGGNTHSGAQPCQKPGARRPARCTNTGRGTDRAPAGRSCSTRHCSVTGTTISAGLLRSAATDSTRPVLAVVHVLAANGHLPTTGAIPRASGAPDFRSTPTNAGRPWRHRAHRQQQL